MTPISLRKFTTFQKRVLTPTYITFLLYVRARSEMYKLTNCLIFPESRNNILIDAENISVDFFVSIP